MRIKESFKHAAFVLIVLLPLIVDGSQALERQAMAILYIDEEPVPHTSMNDLRLVAMTQQPARAAISPRTEDPAAQIVPANYSLLFLVVVLLCVVQSLVIVGLLLSRLQRKDEALDFSAEFVEAERRHLGEVVSNVPGIVWESGLKTSNEARPAEFVSNYVETMLGYTVREWLSEPCFWLSVIVEEDRDRVWRATQEVLRSGNKRVFQFRCRAKDRRIVWAEAHVVPIRDDSGRLIGVRGVTMDITDRKIAEQSLRESDERFGNLADAAPVLIWASGQDKYCTYFNKRWLEFTGRTLEQEIRFGWAVGVHPEDYERCLGTYFKAFDSRQSFQMEYRLRRHDGEYRWIVDVGVARFRPDGAFLGYIGSAVDITEAKRAEEELRATQSELARVARFMTTGELAANIAHEVYQPLTAVVANASAALRWLQTERVNIDQAREAVADVVTSARRASDVVKRIHALFKKGSHRKETITIKEVIEEVITIVRGDCSRKRISLDLDLEPDLPEIEVDRVELQQVLLNLIMNGVDAMAGVTNRPRKLVVGTARVDSNLIEVWVRDSGVGISSNNLDHIFDVFYTTKPEGMGMGLAICRTIIQAHNGRLWATANKDHGITVRFVLPVATHAASEQSRGVPDYRIGVEAR